MRRRRRRVLVPATVVTAVAVAGAAGTVPLLRDRSQQRLEHRAEREVAMTAQRARAELLASPAAPRERLRQAAGRVEGVEVLAVQEQRDRADAGVRLVFRVRVAKTAASVFGWQQADSTGCFAQVVRPADRPAAIERLPCPA